MYYISTDALNSILQVGSALVGADRSAVKRGMKFGRQTAKEYARMSVVTGDISESYAALRQVAIQRASTWVAGLEVDPFSSLDDVMDAVSNVSDEALRTNDAFRNQDERDQIDQYAVNAILSILAEDSGFEVSPGWSEIEVLRRPWVETFGLRVFDPSQWEYDEGPF
jgi:hypothetical protein